MSRTGPRSPLRSLAAHPIVTIVLTVLGIVAGVLAARAMPVSYTAESRLAVVSATNNAYSIPGYPLAARELAADYSRWVQNNATSGAWAPPGTTSVSASPIPDSAVIRVEVQARSQQEATRGAEKVAATLVKTVADTQAQHDPQRAFDDFSKQAPGVAQARARAQQAETAYSSAVGARASASRLRTLATQLQAARVTLAQVELKQNAAASLYQRLYADTSGASTLKVIVPAAAVGAPERTALMRYGVLGGALGLFVALLLAVALDRRRNRRDQDSRASRDAQEPSGSGDLAAGDERATATAHGSVDPGTGRSRRTHSTPRRVEADAG